METEVRIQVPEGMEIDRENSTFECIKFKPKKVTYRDIQKKLLDRYTCYTYTTPAHESKCVTFRKLLEVADYLNGDWKPDWNNKFEEKYFLVYNYTNKIFEVENCYYRSSRMVFFSSRDNALKAVDIIGKEELKQLF